MPNDAPRTCVLCRHLFLWIDRQDGEFGPAPDEIICRKAKFRSAELRVDGDLVGHPLLLTARTCPDYEQVKLPEEMPDGR